MEGETGGIPILEGTGSHVNGVQCLSAPFSGGSAMSHETHDDVVKIYSGSLVTAELYQQALQEAGIESKVVGLSLTASFGSAIPGSVELIIKSEDMDKARAAIEQYEAENKKD
jgi:hypothetical protein